MNSQLQPIAGVKKIIAVASGKGGVGKSTTAVNLALSLQQQGHTVGILDADIYGPNQAQLLGTKQRASTRDDVHFEPVISHGLQSMSMAYLLDEDTPMIWRGPMVISAFKQIIQQTAWRSVDYLIIDLPPGTGDVQLSLAQTVPVTGAVIVTTPQDVALLDVRRAIRMFEKLKLPILGIIENMSGYQCPQCGHHDPIFGEHGADQLAIDFNSQLLGRIPLDRRHRELSDRGTPIVTSEPDSKISQAYASIAKQLISKIAGLKRSAEYLFSHVSVEQS